MKQISVFLITLIFFAACERAQDNDEILKFYGDAKEDIGYSVAIAADGYYICGQMTELTRTTDRIITGSSTKPCIIKTGFDGNIIWKKTFGNKLQGFAAKVLVMDNGSVICTGQVTDTITLESELMVAKINSDGSGAVEKVYEATGNQTGCDIIQTAEGFMILATTDAERLPITLNTGNIQGKKDIVLVRINSSLEQIVAPSAIGYPNNDFGVAIKHDIGGGYIIAGTTDKSETGKTGYNLFLIRINSDGSATEPAIIGGTDDEFAADLEVLNDGYLFAATVGQSVGDQSAYIQKIPLDIYSDPLPPVIIENTDSWSVKAMSRYKANAFVVAGKSGGATSEILLFAVDAEGNQLTGKELTRGSTGIQEANDVVSDSEGYVIAVGKNSYETNSLITLLKFRF